MEELENSATGHLLIEASCPRDEEHHAFLQARESLHEVLVSIAGLKTQLARCSDQPESCVPCILA